MFLYINSSLGDGISFPFVQKIVCNAALMGQVSFLTKSEYADKVQADIIILWNSKNILWEQDACILSIGNEIKEAFKNLRYTFNSGNIFFHVYLMGNKPTYLPMIIYKSIKDIMFMRTYSYNILQYWLSRLMIKSHSGLIPVSPIFYENIYYSVEADYMVLQYIAEVYNSYLDDGPIILRAVELSLLEIAKKFKISKEMLPRLIRGLIQIMVAFLIDNPPLPKLSVSYKGNDNDVHIKIVLELLKIIHINF